MEGPLWKWTNYFSGWQPRWFILNDGILSYYKSQDDVISGCKGSVKMAVCDVSVHATDSTRLDLIIPGEAHFYVKAATAQERQQWLVALGSCKACLATPNRKASDADEVISPDILKVKKSELRLYCDLLMQQVHGVKTAVSNGVIPDVEKLNEATSLLSATCDTFIKTLEDCMTEAQAKAGYESNSKAAMQRSNSADSKFSGSSSHKHSKTPDGASSSSSRHLARSKSESSASHPNSEAQSSYDYTYDHYQRDNSMETSINENNDIEDSDYSNAEQGQSSEDTSNGGHTEKHQSNLHNGRTKFKQYETFFTAMPATFKQIQLETDGGIPVKPYLDACKAILAIFDKLSSTAFAPVKMDIDGNIKKINQKYITDPERFSTLQTMALHDKKAEQSHMSSSATCAMLWLKRAIEFIREFLAEILSGKPDLSECANSAYTRTLRPFHGWVVRGVFGLAVKSLPYRKDFLSHLAMSQEDFEQADFMACLMSHIENYVMSQDVVLKVMTDFFHKNDLDSSEQV